METASRTTTVVLVDPIAKSGNIMERASRSLQKGITFLNQTTQREGWLYAELSESTVSLPNYIFLICRVFKFSFV